MDVPSRTRGAESRSKQRLEQPSPALACPGALEFDYALDPAHEATVAVNHDDPRGSVASVGSTGASVGIQKDGERELMAFDPCAHCFPRFLQVNGEHGQPAATKRPVHVDDVRGNLPRTLPSPGRPEVEEDRATAEAGEGDSTAVESAEGEPGRRPIIERDTRDAHHEICHLQMTLGAVPAVGITEAECEDDDRCQYRRGEHEFELRGRHDWLHDAR